MSRESRLSASINGAHQDLLKNRASVENTKPRAAMSHNRLNRRMPSCAQLQPAWRVAPFY